MKKITILSVLLLCLLAVNAQKTNPNYDAKLATKVGADDYGMKSYTLVILKTGANTSKDKKQQSEAFAGHMANINKMVEAKQLIVAGPIAANPKNYRGIFVLTETDLEKARALLETDPAIKAKYLDVELYAWYGSAALSEYLEASDKVWRLGF